MSRFAKGDKVVLVADARREGMVQQVSMQGGVPLYRVFWGGGHPATDARDEDLLPVAASAAAPFDQLLAGQWSGPEALRRLVTVERLKRDRPLRGTLFAIHASRTQFYAYQFKPLLKLLDSDRQRILIADEVGLGKTIEAGLIMVELAARTDLRKIIVVAPSRLRNKWKSEMQRRFGLEFEELSGAALRERRIEQDGQWASTPLLALVSLESLRNVAEDEFLDTLDPDLVVIDEAHHLRNPTARQTKAVVSLADSAQALVMLTATPIHLQNRDLWALLRLIDSDAFGDEQTALQRIEANRHVVSAERHLASDPPNLQEAVLSLAQVVGTPWGGLFSPTLTAVAELLRHPSGTHPRAEIRALRDDVARLNLLGHAITRTRKRDVHTHVPKRVAEVVRAPMTAPERAIYQAVVAFVASEIARRHGQVTGWFLTTPRRRLASSLPAMVAHYRGHLAPAEDDDDYEEDEAGDDQPDPQARAGLVRALAGWTDACTDSKYELLRRQLRQLAAEGGNKKVVIFASYRDTLNYLAKRLEADGVRALVMHGQTPVVKRAELLRSFEQNPEIRVLLTGRVGSEGLDLQFAEVLVNYDLPWNPMEVEQRIGRLDRLGQKADAIRILSLSLADTIEDRVLAALYDRIGLFKASIGDLEPILSDEIHADIEHCLVDPQLSDAERLARVDEIVRVTAQRREENERLEREAARLVAVDELIDAEIRQISGRRGFVTPEQAERLVRDFLAAYPRSRLEDAGNGLQRLRVGDDLLAFIRSKDLAGELAHWFAAAPDGMPVTFRQEVAYERTGVEFLSVVHPFLQAFIGEVDGAAYGQAALVGVASAACAAGEYLFRIAEVRVTSARPERFLWLTAVNLEDHLVVEGDDAEALLADMLERGMSLPGTTLPPELTETMQEAYARAKDRMEERVASVRAHAKRTNAQTLEARRGSVMATLDRKIRLTDEQLARALANQRQERIISLHRGRLRNLKQDRARRLELIDAAREVSIETRELAVGVVEVGAP